MKHLIVCLVLLVMIVLPACSDGFSLSDLRRIGTEVAARVFLDSEEGVMLIGYDQLAFPNDVIEIEAQLLNVGEMAGIAGATITFYEGADRLGRARTDVDGFASLEWQNRGVGDYYFEAEITRVSRETDEDILEIDPIGFRVTVREADTEFIVVDLDHTLVASNFFMVLLGEAEPMEHSQRVMHRLSTEYSIIYLTHRPDLLGQRSRNWLSDHGYPAGAILLSELEETFGSSGAFKTQTLDEIRAKFPYLEYGIGDKISDVQAYIDNGMTGYLIPYYDRDDEDDIRDLIDDIENIRDRWRLQVVDDWWQIEEAFFEGADYPWDVYVDNLLEQVDEDD